MSYNVKYNKKFNNGHFKRKRSNRPDNSFYDWEYKLDESVEQQNATTKSQSNRTNGHGNTTRQQDKRQYGSSGFKPIQQPTQQSDCFGENQNTSRGSPIPNSGGHEHQPNTSWYGGISEKKSNGRHWTSCEKNKILGRKCSCGKRGEHNCIYSGRVSASATTDTISIQSENENDNNTVTEISDAIIDAEVATTTYGISTINTTPQSTIVGESNVDNNNGQGSHSPMYGPRSPPIPQGYELVRNESPSYTCFSPGLPAQETYAHIVNKNVNKNNKNRTSSYNKRTEKDEVITKLVASGMMTAPKAVKTTEQGVKTLVSNNPDQSKNGVEQGVKTLVSNNPDLPQQPLPEVRIQQRNTEKKAKLIRFEPNILNEALGWRHSTIDLDVLNNHYTGDLSALKNQKRLVSDEYMDENLYRYLLASKFNGYNNRKECLDHMSKVAIKYLNENNIKIETQSNYYINRYKITVQKATDELDTKFFLDYQDPDHNVKYPRIRETANTIYSAIKKHLLVGAFLSTPVLLASAMQYPKLSTIALTGLAAWGVHNHSRSELKKFSTTGYEHSEPLN